MYSAFLTSWHRNALYNVEGETHLKNHRCVGDAAAAILQQNAHHTSAPRVGAGENHQSEDD